MPEGKQAPSLPEINELVAAHPGYLDEHVDELESARFLNVKPGTLSVWRCRGVGPPYVKIGSLVRYVRRDLFEYSRAHRKVPRASAK